MNPQDKNTKVAFWLVPAREEAGFLAQLIQALATRYEALLFEPHVTIFSTDAALLGSPEAVLKTAVEEMYAFSLTVARCGYTSEFNKTFFIQFRPSECLTMIHERLGAQTSGPSDYRLDPHLSLLYQHISEEEKRRLVETVHIPKTEILFDEVAAIAHGGAMRQGADVTGWRECARIKLAPATPSLTGHGSYY